ncbi:hypothetical protein PsorP6_001994 [Peronosclerospora sorghi]|uniref:Uncharacterized protein n=1 Tax=Peronosclerospora sorghi TaxID=230839 RepID=A0ACC0WY12_9STRA|nr:hypothetical protein PsorP6_001994 [Peronosclerospora sorghi]
MALWSKHRADWSEAHNPAVYKYIANDFIVHSYGVFHSLKNQKDKVSRELIDLHAEFVKIKEKEPELLEKEGNLVDEEWMKLAKEREHWTSGRANIKREDEIRQASENGQDDRSRSFCTQYGDSRAYALDRAASHSASSDRRRTLTDERKADYQLFSEHREDCKNTLNEARNKLTITPEYVARPEADMKVRASELQAVKDSHKRRPQEGGDAEVDERDEFMNDVRRRRAQFQKELDDQSAHLKAENKLCKSLLERINQHIKNREEEVQNAAVEEQNIRQFNELIETETKLLMDEETKRAIWAQVEDVYNV